MEGQSAQVTGDRDGESVHKWKLSGFRHRKCWRLRREPQVKGDEEMGAQQAQCGRRGTDMGLLGERWQLGCRTEQGSNK